MYRLADSSHVSQSDVSRLRKEAGQAHKRWHPEGQGGQDASDQHQQAKYHRSRLSEHGYGHRTAKLITAYTIVVTLPRPQALASWGIAQVPSTSSSSLKVSPHPFSFRNFSPGPTSFSPSPPSPFFRPPCTLPPPRLCPLPAPPTSASALLFHIKQVDEIR